MNTDVLKKIFENSESKNIDIWCDGKLSIQFQCTQTEVKDEYDGTISVVNKSNGNVLYIDTHHVSNVWIGEPKKENSEDDVFI